MKLIRLAHKDVAHLLLKDPLSGCIFHSGYPYFYLFDAVPAAILESQLYRVLGEIPRNIVAVQYTLPDKRVLEINTNDAPFYGDYMNGNYYLGKWVVGFLREKSALIASFPSKNFGWAKMKNYIVNPNHEHFHSVEISDIWNIYRH